MRRAELAFAPADEFPDAGGGIRFEHVDPNRVRELLTDLGITPPATGHLTTGGQPIAVETPSLARDELGIGPRLGGGP